MIRIGIIGSQSMHSLAFAKECNIPDEEGRYLIPDCRVTAICGIDDTKEHTAETAQKGNIQRTVETPERLYDICDAVMILTRRGETHIEYALPFLKKGIPVFIDKPVCISDEDISRLKKAAEQGNCVIAGGSGLKHCGSVKALKEKIDSGVFGNVRGISLNHGADIDCEYNGIYFYACHAVEIMLTLLGGDYGSVTAAVFNHNNFNAFVRYPEQFADLIFTDARSEYFVNVYGDKKCGSFLIDQSDIFRNTIIDFADKVRNLKTTKAIDDLIAHIYVLRKIERAVASNNYLR